MEILIILGMIIIIVLLTNIRSGQTETAEKNKQYFLSLKKELSELKTQLDTNTPLQKESPIQTSEENERPWISYKERTPVQKTESPAETIKEEKTIEEKTVPPFIAQQVENVEPEPAPENLWDKWVRNNPDLEKFIGENLVNKIGIAVLVLGIAFFVKYAIDQDWIKEAGRVSIGIGCGIIMIGIAHRLSNLYRSFSSVMAGGGIAVFYFTIAFAFHEYQLFSQTTAFVIMVVITAFAVTLAILYDKIELAVIAVIGGFLVPFLVSNGSNNYVALFTYLLILNIGLLILAYFKKWPLLHVLSFFFTLFIFGVWMIQEYSFGSSDKILPNNNALFFASAFYFVFLTTVLIHNIRKQKPFKAFDFSLLIMITASYYAEGMVILKSWNYGAYQGIFTIVLGVVNLCLAWYLHKKQKGDKNLLYLLIGLTVTFISLAAPVQLHGHSITLFWSAEAVLLYWLHLRSSMSTFKYSSVIVSALMLVSLMLDWSLANQHNNEPLIIIFNNLPGIITNIVVIISLGLYAFLLQKKREDHYIIEIKNKYAAVFMAVAAVIILYATCVFGINLYFLQLQGFAVPNAYHQLITYIFIAIITWAMKKCKPFENGSISIALIIAGFIFYLAGSQLAGNLLTGITKNEQPGIYGIIHWLASACMLMLLYQLVLILRKDIKLQGKFFAWLINIMLLLFFSIECKHIYVFILGGPTSIDKFTTQYLKAGLTIVWALCSFVIMWLGMKFKYKTLRIISLSIFTIALLKLFLSDIRNITAGGKIAAFIMLGILLLVISFMYQRLKKIIIDDEKKTV